MHLVSLTPSYYEEQFKYSRIYMVSWENIAGVVQNVIALSWSYVAWLRNPTYIYLKLDQHFNFMNTI